MEIRIIGGGAVGGALARGLCAAGHAVTVGLRQPASERGILLSKEGLSVCEMSDAVAGAEVVILAIPVEALEQVVPDLSITAGTILVDATNAVRTPVPSGKSTVFEYVVELAPRASVVKAFNTIGAEHLSDGHLPEEKGVFLPIAGHGPGRSVVMKLAADLGFDAVDLGGADAVHHVENHARLWIHLAFACGFGRDFAFAVVRR